MAFYGINLRTGKVLDKKILCLNYDEDCPLERKAMDIMKDFHQLCQYHEVNTKLYFPQFYSEGIFVVDGTYYEMQEARLIVMKYEEKLRKICDNCFHVGSKIDEDEQRNIPLCKKNHDLEAGRKGLCAYFHSAYYPSDHESFKEMKTPEQMIDAVISFQG